MKDNKEFPIYLKLANINEIVEITKDGWISICKGNNDDDSIRFEIHYRKVEFADEWHSLWHRATKPEFDSLKFEFLNWIDATFQRAGEPYNEDYQLPNN